MIDRSYGKSYLCKGGPFHNKAIELTNGQRTLAFSVNGCKPGLYRPAVVGDNPISLSTPYFCGANYDMVWVEELDDK